MSKRPPRSGSDEEEDDEDITQVLGRLDSEDDDDDEEQTTARKAKGKSRGMPSDDDDEEEEDTEEDDEVEESDGRAGRAGGKKKGAAASAASRKKRQKTAQTSLLDLEAEVEDDDEDEDEEEGLGGMIEEDEGVDFEAASEHVARAQRMRRELANEVGDPEELERALKERYDRFDQMEDEWSLDEDEAIPFQEGPEPTPDDPKLYKVPCKPGREREAVICLLQKHFNMIKRNMPLTITSAVAPEHLKGFIYVEAAKKDAVEIACKGMQLLSAYENQIKVVPLGEMKDVLAVPMKQEDIKKGDWVRIRQARNEYNGDLAQVFEVRPGGPAERCVTVRLIPRLDFQTMRARELVQRNAEDEEDEDEVASVERSRAKELVKRRMPQKLFIKEEVERELGQSVGVHRDHRYTGEVFDEFDKQLFKHSLVYKHLTRRMIVHGSGVIPKAEELALFESAEQLMKERQRKNEDEDEDTLNDYDDRERDLGLKQSGIQSIATFYPGDMAVIPKNEFKGLVAKLISVSNENCMIRLVDRSLGLLDIYDWKTWDLSKHFSEGTHVKVLHGEHEGKTGMVVNVDGDLVTIFADSSKEDVTVKANALVESSEFIASGARRRAADAAASGGANGASVNQAHTEFALFDLVSPQQNRSLGGIVVKVSSDSVRIMNEKGKVRSYELDAVDKIQSFQVKRTCFDRNQVQLKEGDSVRVVEGPHVGRSGFVKQMMNATVFFQAKDEVENAGVLAVSSNDVALEGVGRSSAALQTGAGGGASFRSRFSASGAGGHTAGFRAGGGTGGFEGTGGFSRGVSNGGVGLGTGGGFGGFGSSGNKPPMSGGGAFGPGSRPGMVKDELLEKFVRIKKGDYKGHRGRVVGASGNKVTIELDSKSKKLNLPRDMVAPVDANASLVQAGNNNPKLFNGANAFSHAGTGGSQFSSRSAFRPPAASTLNVSSGRSIGAGASYETDLYSAPGSRTPMYAGAATPSHSARPETPGFDRDLDYSYVGAAAAVPVPVSAATEPNGSGRGAGGVDLSRLASGLLVGLAVSLFAGGTRKEGQVLSVSGSIASVKLAKDALEDTRVASLTLVSPSKGDQVRVLVGSKQGFEGEMIAIDKDDATGGIQAVIRSQGGEIEVCPLDEVGKI
ncbi:Transcription elongation factor SPT5 [Porphyridium purpureum]|uniref:Transcription elongation factor SPT5 n=1 Tax=Porphyridium purpureum TaxID=35688 RepID=A0A5J4Z1M2_PORPP|nr:Transcription elongation factor SPT5 [Porphyridium purpureum]|eukprot:POR2021..scf295_1